MLECTRRDTLLALGTLGAWTALQPLRSAPGGRRPTGRDDAIERLAAALRSAPRARAFELAADAIRAGARLETLLGAVLLIGVEDVRPRPHGILHTVMMVHSSFALADGAGEQEAWLAALWNLDDLATARERDRDEDGDWSMPPRPDARAPGPEAARRELSAALDAWDTERADRGVVALLPHVDLRSLFELIWPYAARCNAFIGHKIIYAAQLERALRRIGGRRLLEPAARSLVPALLVERDTATWDGHREHAAEPGARGTSRTTGAESALALYRLLRTSDVDQSLSITLEALAGGVGPQSVWDALRLVASETFHRRSGRRSNSGRNALLPVHALTVVNALGHVARTSPDAILARRCLLEAVSRMPLMRDWLVASTGLAQEGPALEALGEELGEAPARLEDALGTGSPAEVCAHLRLGTTSVERYAAHVRTPLLRTAREHHQHKFAAAMLEEATLAHPVLRPLILAPAAEYVANPLDDTTDVHERSLAALRRAGLR